MSQNQNGKREEKENKLKLIPKAEKYIEYVLQIIFKLPRVEKFSIGTEYKTGMYQMLQDILIISKIEKSISKIDISRNLNEFPIYLFYEINGKRK